MNSILIDLATATNVLVVVVNLILVAANMVILIQMQHFLVRLPGSDETSKNVGASIFRRVSTSSTIPAEKLPVKSAAEHIQVEKERRQAEAARLAGQATIKDVVDNY